MKKAHEINNNAMGKSLPFLSKMRNYISDFLMNER